METFDFSSIRGFNYQPSAGSTSFENWRYFRPELFELELRRGKQYFPKFNTVRYWLSWDAFIREPRNFADHFEVALKIADSLGLRVIPCLFNRWHNEFNDNGGLYLDNIIPGYGLAYRPHFYKEYFDIIVGEHKNDKRILVWDLCNEPFSLGSPGVWPFVIAKLESGDIEVDSIISHRLPLKSREDFLNAFALMEERRDNVCKVILHP